MSAVIKDREVAFDVKDLKVGMYIRINAAWKDHPFLMNSFVIKNEKHLATVREYCRTVYVDLDRSKVYVSIPNEDEHDGQMNSEPPSRAPSNEVDHIRSNEDAARLRQRIARTQSVFIESAKKTGEAMRQLDRDPALAFESLERVASESVETISTDADSAINLIISSTPGKTEISHGLSVMTLSLVLGKSVNLDPRALQILGTGALLHDIGERDIPSGILRNQSRGKAEENLYRTHSSTGVEYLKKYGIKTRGVHDAVLYHHESYDGSGFPYGIGGAQIPLVARIIAIASVFDGLTNMYKDDLSLSPAAALSKMYKEKHKYDLNLLLAFIKRMGVYPPGTLVGLSSGQKGVVTASPELTGTRPEIMIYDPQRKKTNAMIVNLEQERDLRIERTLKPSEITREELDYLLPKRNIGFFFSRS